MNFAEPLIPARLIRRYKRFLADVEFDDGREATAHCANPGAMTGLAEPGMRVWLEPTPDPKRKLDFAWRLVEVGAGFACIDTGAANKVVEEALRAGAVAGFDGYAEIRREVKYGEKSRIDFLLTNPYHQPCYLEVKSVTLRRGGFAEFPDTVTARGARHLAELARMKADGARAATLYLVQRTDCEAVRIAADIDPAYAGAYLDAREAGVETAAFAAEISPNGVILGAPRPFIAPDAA